MTVADPGREFGWAVGEDWVRWNYRVEPDGEGTLLTESRDFTDAGLAMFAERFGDRADDEVQLRIRAAHEGTPATLSAIKRLAETG